MQINQPAPEFQLPDLKGNLYTLHDSLGKIVIVNFWSAECPYSERTDQSVIAHLEQWGGKVELLSVAANRNESAHLVEDVANARHLPIVLLDSQLVVANLYEAVTTPHAFVIDREGILRYRGAVDDMTFRQRQATRFYLQEAVEALLAGRAPQIQETIAYGCAIVREI